MKAFGTSVKLTSAISFGLLCFAQSALAETTQVATMDDLDNWNTSVQVALIDTHNHCRYSGSLVRIDADKGYKVIVERKACDNEVGTLVEEIKGTVVLGEFPVVSCVDNSECHRVLRSGSIAVLEYSK